MRQFYQFKVCRSNNFSQMQKLLEINFSWIQNSKLIKPKLISRKINVAEKFFTLQNVYTQCGKLEIFRHSDFTWNQVWQSWGLKNYHFALYSSSEFRHFQMWNILKNQNLGPLKWLKLHFLSFWQCQIWFHVKFEW